MPDDERGDEPIRLRKLIDVVIEDKVSFMLFRATIADISATGMRVISDQYLPKGTRYTFTFKRAPFFVLRGEVRWVRAQERETVQCGVTFVDLSDEDRRKLREFVEIERQRVPTN
ncbi:MAG: PilZ domain-containing protein [Candidatus Eremiobacteraeota bacterium]|nr:PilZ domain-containing protein [Candidatus Eremiobacteraeota bacterium]